MVRGSEQHATAGWWSGGAGRGRQCKIVLLLAVHTNRVYVTKYSESPRGAHARLVKLGFQGPCPACQSNGRGRGRGPGT